MGGVVRARTRGVSTGGVRRVGVFRLGDTRLVVRDEINRLDALVRRKAGVPDHLEASDDGEPPYHNYVGYKVASDESQVIG
jgi:hypothetical protein